jgi:hypothetical protein
LRPDGEYQRGNEPFGCGALIRRWAVRLRALEEFTSITPVGVVVGLNRREVVQPIEWLSEIIDIAESDCTTLVPHKPKESFGKGAGDVGRTCEILVLFLAEPAQRIANVDANSMDVGLVGAASVVQGSEI